MPQENHSSLVHAAAGTLTILDSSFILLQVGLQISIGILFGMENYI